jgi:hypothetical protein
MNYNDIIKQAFLDELRSIHAARGEHVDVDKLAADPRIEAMLKEAQFLKAVRGGLQRAGEAAAAGAGKVRRVATPTGRQLAKYEEAGLGDVAGKALKEQGALRRAEQWGKAQRQTPAQRMTAARKASTDPTEKAMLTVKGPDKAQQMAELQRTTEQIGGTSRAKRMIGGTVEGSAHHARKHPVGMVINPIGVPMGGAIEGATRQLGREAGAAGLKRTGKALRQHAGKVGLAGEVAGMAGLGTALHAPLSGQALLGKAMTAPLEAGGYGGHLLADVVGTKALKVAPKFVKPTLQAAGRALG